MAFLPETIGLMPSPLKASAKLPQGDSERDAALRETAREFEATFIGEMLSHTGLDKALSQNSGFGGEAFSVMLVEVYADKLSNNGGFGIAEKIYNQMKDDAA